MKLDTRTREGLLKKLKVLALQPSLGKPLVGELSGCCRVTFGRARCIVRVADGVAVALVIAVAQRKEGSKDDAYALAIDFMVKNRVEAEAALMRHIRAFLEADRSAHVRRRNPENPAGS